jgi:ankyrin repeat protein
MFISNYVIEQCLHLWISKLNIFCFKQLLILGVDPNAKNEYGNTWCHELVRNFEQSQIKKMAMLRLLIENKADWNLFNNEGLAPVHEVCLEEQIESIKYMIELNKTYKRKIFDFELKGKFSQITIITIYHRYPTTQHPYAYRCWPRKLQTNTRNQQS